MSCIVASKLVSNEFILLKSYEGMSIPHREFVE